MLSLQETSSWEEGIHQRAIQENATKILIPNGKSQSVCQSCQRKEERISARRNIRKRYDPANKLVDKSDLQLSTQYPRLKGKAGRRYPRLGLGIGPLLESFFQSPRLRSSMPHTTLMIRQLVLPQKSAVTVQGRTMKTSGILVVYTRMTVSISLPSKDLVTG